MNANRVGKQLDEDPKPPQSSSRISLKEVEDLVALSRREVALKAWNTLGFGWHGGVSGRGGGASVVGALGCTS
jgi:hypothetical protein